MKRFILIITLACLMLMLVACNGQNASGESSAAEQSEEQSDANVSVEASTEVSEVSEAPVIVGAVNHSGTFRTNYDCDCNLFLDYTVVSISEDELNVTVNVRLECRQISVSARNNLGRVIIGDETYTYSTPALVNYETEPTSFEFVTQSRQVSRGEGDLELEISASWPFRGQYYSGKNPISIDDMRAGGVLTISPDGNVKVALRE